MHRHSMLAGSATHAYVWLQAPPRMVAGSATYGCRLRHVWLQARRPLSYLGTRSELENEILRVRVYDWDRLSADDLIGQADVPLNGLLEYGQVEIDLAYNEEDTSAPKVRGVRPKKLVQAGRLVGQITFEGSRPTPKYKQLGNIVERIGGVSYLAVKVVAAHNLKPADVSGFSDPFVTVEWDGCEQISKVISSNLNPTWNETLYFPLKCAKDKAVLEQKPCVSVRVYDLDESGSDLLGQCEVHCPLSLHKITEAATLCDRGCNPMCPGAATQDHFGSARQDRRRGARM